MLQQTQVATVEPYFDRFMREFPDIHTLAAADEQHVLRLWEGLGYYRRARQLHQAARVLVQKHGGQFPRDPETVRSLPGIGRYTAGAILSIAFDARQPVLEANTVRVLTRLLAYRHEPSRAPGQRLLWSVAQQLLPRQHVGSFNQALMELGSEICTWRSPKCDICPLARDCATNQYGWQDRIPVRKSPQRYQEIREVAVVIRRRGRVLLRQCGAQQRWAGLWDFPRFAIPSAEDLESEVHRQVRKSTGLTIRTGERLTRIKHGVTRFRITLDCYEATVVSGRLCRHASGSTRWVRPMEFENYALSVTGRKISRLLLPDDAR
jgi:A/G-specific adenine glycosylase